MTLLPIVERELRVAARQRGTYWMRSGIALAVIGIGMFIYLAGRGQAPAEVSFWMFTWLAIIAGAFCLFSGARATADCLSEEKRDGTLGLEQEGVVGGVVAARHRGVGGKVSRKFKNLPSIFRK